MCGFIDGGETVACRGLGNVCPGKTQGDRTTNHLGEEGDDLSVGLGRGFNVPDWLEMGGLRGASKRFSGGIWG